jgi:hypothetical protein
MKSDETHRVDELNARQVHIVLRVLIDQFVVVN